jgi:hypothetical protein
VLCDCLEQQANEKGQTNMDKNVSIEKYRTYLKRAEYIIADDAR